VYPAEPDQIVAPASTSPAPGDTPSARQAAEDQVEEVIQVGGQVERLRLGVDPPLTVLTADSPKMPLGQTVTAAQLAFVTMPATRRVGDVVEQHVAGCELHDDFPEPCMPATGRPEPWMPAGSTTIPRISAHATAKIKCATRAIGPSLERCQPSQFFAVPVP
jgi:hypothetical protein